ncbi:MAG: sulfatase [Bacteroidales bacterium]|nr:sulfatase [Bacteroidales bacterium]
MIQKNALTLFSAVTILSLPSCTKEKKNDQAPNFIFILVDDLGWTDLGEYGSSFYETENLDQLATQGVRFTDAYASCPVSSPTRASIMTGKYPTRLNITDWIPGNDPKNRKLIGPVDDHMLPLEEITIAEALKENGYTTFFAGKWHLGDTGFFPEDQGFDINLGGHHKGSPPGGYYTPYKNPKLEDGPEGEYLTDRLTSESITFIEENQDNPFFIYLSFYTVHTPIQANLEYVDYFRKKRLNLGENGKPMLESEHTGNTLTNQMNEEYASMVYAMDKNVGRIISYLEQNGLSDNTYIIFTSDNGGLSTVRKNRTAPTSVRPLRAGKGWCYEGGIRVPLIITGPGIMSGRVSNQQVISTDYYPTILELAGLPMLKNQHKDGISLVPLLKENKKIEREAIFWHYPHYHSSQWTPGAAIRSGDWKLIEFYDLETTELYNLADDIGEKHDLSETFPDKRDELKTLLLKMQNETGATLPDKNSELSPINEQKSP